MATYEGGGGPGSGGGDVNVDEVGEAGLAVLRHLAAGKDTIVEELFNRTRGRGGRERKNGREHRGRENQAESTKRTPAEAENLCCRLPGVWPARPQQSRFTNTCRPRQDTQLFHIMQPAPSNRTTSAAFISPFP